MMRYLKPVSPSDHEQLTRTCAHWFKDELGVKIVEYHLGNTFTGSIDMLATDGKNVLLITIDVIRFEDALLRSLMGFRWYHENKDFLRRVYPREEIDLSLPPVIAILSATFPPDVLSILDQAVKIPARLFLCRTLGDKGDPDLFIEELLPPHVAEELIPADFSELVRELAIEKADLTDDEIVAFRKAMRG